MLMHATKCLKVSNVLLNFLINFLVLILQGLCLILNVPSFYRKKKIEQRVTLTTLNERPSYYFTCFLHQLNSFEIVVNRYINFLLKSFITTFIKLG